MLKIIPGILLSRCCPCRNREGKTAGEHRNIQLKRMELRSVRSRCAGGVVKSFALISRLYRKTGSYRKRRRTGRCVISSRSKITAYVTAVVGKTALCGNRTSVNIYTCIRSVFTAAYTRGVSFALCGYNTAVNNNISAGCFVSRADTRALRATGCNYRSAVYLYSSCRAVPACADTCALATTLRNYNGIVSTDSNVSYSASATASDTRAVLNTGSYYTAARYGNIADI